MNSSLTRRLRWLAVVLTFLAGAPVVQAQYINIRVSAKFILNTNGLPPSGRYANSNDWRLATDNANAGNVRFWRGYRYQYPSFDGNISGYGQYYRLDQSEAVHFEYAMRANAGQTGWRNDALNVYVVSRNLGDPGAEGCAGWASNPEDVIILGPPYGSMNGRITVFCANMEGAPGSELSILGHEFGHHLGLIHTWADDRVADTVVDADPTPCEQDGLPDWCSCKYSNTLARAAAQGWSQSVLRTATNNLMSYHCGNDDDFDLTEGQLDRWADIARRYLASEMTGVTYFVDRNNSQGGNDGYSSNPYRTVQAGVTAATTTSGNILVVRPGSYNEQITIANPVTLRATRAGPVTIGQP